MLPASYQLPAAIVLLVGGIVACFFGYRLFRIVLAIFGFILGRAGRQLDLRHERHRSDDRRVRSSAG